MKIRSVEFSGTVMDAGSPLPGDLPQVAFSGRSNVGKSSLINTLLGRTRSKVAHVSSTPGKTQGLNFYRVNDRFFLVDLPGFGFAKVPDHVREAWKPLVEGYLTRHDGPSGVVHLVDCRRDPTADDQRMIGYLSQLELPMLLVITKIDKLTRGKRREVVNRLTEALELDQDQVIAFSSKTGEGRAELLEALSALLTSRDTTASGMVKGDA